MINNLIKRQKHQVIETLIALAGTNKILNIYPDRARKGD